jgi:hypothetical protein
MHGNVLCGHWNFQVEEIMQPSTATEHVISALRYWRQALQMEQDCLRRIEEAVRRTPMEGLNQVMENCLAAGRKGKQTSKDIEMIQFYFNCYTHCYLWSGTAPSDIKKEPPAEGEPATEKSEKYWFTTGEVYPMAVKKESGVGYFYRCSACGVEKGSKNGVKAHINLFHKNRVLSCTEENCNYTTYNPDGLAQHTRLKHAN